MSKGWHMILISNVLGEKSLAISSCLITEINLDSKSEHCSRNWIKTHECHFFVQHGQTIYESVSRSQRHLQSFPNQCSHEGLRRPEDLFFSMLLFEI